MGLTASSLTDQLQRCVRRRCGRSKGLDHICFVQWNLAGAATSCLEFVTSRSLQQSGSEAERFKFDLNELLRGAIDGGADFSEPFRQQLESLTYAGMMAPLSALESPIAASLLKAARAKAGQQGELLRLVESARRGEVAIGRADLRLQGRFSVTQMSVQNAPELMRMCATGDVVGFWKRWVAELPVEESTENLLSVALVDGLMFSASSFLLQAPGAVEKYGSPEELGRSFCIFIAASGVDVVGKCAGLVRGMQRTCDAFAPDAWSLQEWSDQWLRNESFLAFWERMRRHYVCVEPPHVENRDQMVQLLIRRGGALRFDERRSAALLETRRSARFWELLGKELRTLLGAEAAAATLTKLRQRLPRSLAAAVCRCSEALGGSAGLVLVASCHASSDGTNNRALVLAARMLAREAGAELLLGLDANSNASFPKDKLAKGAATQACFVDFLRSQELQHCFDALGFGASQDPSSLHTVRKTRTFIQFQFKKADVDDHSAKDWIVSSAPTLHGAWRATRLNSFDFVAPPPPASALRGGLDPAVEGAWLDAAFMPRPGFPSDHCLVVARASLGSASGSGVDDAGVSEDSRI